MVRKTEGMDEMSEWQPIETAPYEVAVEVKLDSGKEMEAALMQHWVMDSDNLHCDQWVATGDTFPPCWTDGACWSVNEDGVPSDHPVMWRDTQEPPETA